MQAIAGESVVSTRHVSSRRSQRIRPGQIVPPLHLLGKRSCGNLAGLHIVCASAIATGSPRLLVPMPSSNKVLICDTLDMELHTCLPNVVAGGNDDDDDDDTEATRHKLSRYERRLGIDDAFVIAQAAFRSIVGALLNATMCTRLFDGPSISGQELRQLVMEKWGRSYDIRLHKRGTR